MTAHGYGMERLWLLRETLGPAYGSEHLSILLYAMIRRERPLAVVELGTGLGVSTFWIAQALKENGEGHLWTVDDGSQFPDDTLARNVAPLRALEGFRDALPETSSYDQYFHAMAELLGVAPQVTLLRKRLDLSRLANRGIGELPFHDQRIDFLFSDFQHGPEDVMELLAAFLPNLADSASILVDSASTHWVSYLALERLIEQLERNKLPRRFLATPSERASVLAQVVFSRSFSVSHLIEKIPRDQNSTAWIKVEPNDYLPYPLTRMHPS